MIDFLDCGVNPAEVFKFDRKAHKLHKYVFEKGIITLINHIDDDSSIVKQFIYANKYGNLQQYYKLEENKANNDPIKKKLLVITTSYHYRTMPSM